MLSSSQWKSINSLVEGLNPTQRLWLSGYLAGLDNAQQTQPAAASTQSNATIVYGSQGGNGKQIADALSALLAGGGINSRTLSLADYKTAWLKKETILLVVISTHGEGEPPDDAKAFYDFIFSKRAPSLGQLQYATLALGDSSYEFFCKTGQDVHSRLAELGAQELQPLIECDTDYDEQAAQWRQNVADVLQKQNGNNALPPAAAANAITLPATAAAKEPTRTQPFAAPIVEHIMLTTPPRRTLHIELDLAGANIEYQPGDSIGICPQNPPALADKVASALGLSAEQTITLGDKTADAQEWLTRRLDISRPTANALQRYQQLVGNNKLGKLLEDKTALRDYINGRDYGDVFADFPPPPQQEEAILSCLRRLTPRLYSLASSRALRDEEAHILVSVCDYDGYNAATRYGVCSQYLADKQTGDSVDVYLQRNDKFRLPANGNTPVIMIGPGTGVAPFRAFMEEREASGSSGGNWLFFGNRYRRDEFYYQTEWQAYLKNGLLSKLDVAFSRDGAHKIYVQDKLQQNAAALWQWLKDDAHFYICGDTRMASDVHARLVQIIAEHNGGDGETYLQQMQADGRYQRDIY